MDQTDLFKVWFHKAEPLLNAAFDVSASISNITND